jgi:hypothetical protein
MLFTDDVLFCPKEKISRFKATFLFWGYIFLSVFSSPELKAQVSFSDRPLSVVLLSVRLSV